MDIPSTSLSNLEEEADENTTPVYTDLVSSSDQFLGYEEVDDPYPELLGFVEAQIEFCDQFLVRISEARKRLAEKKTLLEKKAEQERQSGALAKAKLLMSAVARFGAKDWAKVARAVVGRSDGQCRERWCNVLDRCTETGDWTPEEDERLLLGVHAFGRGRNGVDQ
ncbi:hypothetical protein NECAME_04518 [Necator americanus]|uniref:Myb-like DNA-binding domain protein n=1 Tax=Necator americanus TaxID=51031 RepID=W2SS70_NECAM|nr:hypothetical protein NECAME_04518 [Necator americanus]ETN72338.1 hypothetical protein NECAME_04518 [Necator americanus]